MTNPYLDMLQAAPAAAPGGEPPANPYLDMLQSADEQRRQQMAGQLTQAVGVNPEQYTAQRRVAQYLGYPTPVVEAQPHLMGQAKVRQIQQDTANAPVLQRKYTDPDFAKLAHDDAPILSKIETAVSSAVRYAMGADQYGGMWGDLKRGAWDNSVIGTAGAFRMVSELGASAAELVPAVRSLEASGQYGGNPLRRLAEGFAMIGANQQALKDASSPPAEGNIAGGVSSGFQSAGQNLKYLPLAFLGPAGWAAGLTGMVVESGGTTYQKDREDGVPMGTATIHAAADGLAEYVGERYFGEVGFLKRLAAGAPATKLLMWEITRDVPGEIGTTLWQNFNDWALTNPSKTADQFLREQPDAIVQTAIGALVGGGVQVGVGKLAMRAAETVLNRQMEVTETLQREESLKALMQLAGQAKLAERSPEQLQAFVAEASGDATVRFDAAALVDVFKQDANALAQALPSVDLQALQEAAATGGEVTVPLAELVVGAKAAGVEQTVLEHARLGESTLSAAEAREVQSRMDGELQAKVQEVIDQAQDQAAVRASHEAVRANLAQQITATGRHRPAVAEQMATWAASFFTTYGSRLGITAEEMYQRYPLRVVGAPTGQGGGVVEQGAQPSNQVTGLRVEGSKLVDEGGAPVALFHGTDSQFSKFSDSRPNFFTPVEKYATAYGSRVVKAYLNIRAPFDAAADPEARRVYNEEFRKDPLGRDAPELQEGQGVPFTFADEFFGFLYEREMLAGGRTYDGIVVDEGSGLGAEYGDAARYSFVPLDPKQIVSAISGEVLGQGAQPTAPRGTFSPQTLEQGAQDQRDLVVTHNLTADNLLHAVKMGGLAVPSLAVTKKDSPLTGFGEITLIGPPEMADPKGYADTKVFGADIYSPRYPNVERDIDRKAQRKLQDRLKPMADRMGVSDAVGTQELEREGQRTLERSLPLMATFLQERGVEPNIVMRGGMDDGRRARLEQFGLGPFMQTADVYALIENPEFVAAALAEARDAYATLGKRDSLVKALENNERFQRSVVRDTANTITTDAKLRARPEADAYATQMAMEKQIADGGLAEDYRQMVQTELSALTKSERIFQGFTNSGNRKYIPHTLENVVKILKKELRGGENFDYGVGSLRAKFTPQFKSIEQIRKAKDRLVSKEDFEKVKKEIDDQFWVVAAAINKDLSSTTAISILEDATKLGVKRAAKNYGYEISDDAAVTAAEFLTRLRELPTEYFEAKILRDVDLAEFAGAVVPEDADPRVIAALQARGVKDIRTYKTGDEADRKAKLGEFESLFFQNQQAPRGTFSPQTLELVLNPNANLSTWFHETGHFFLEVLADVASQPNAPAQIVEDMNTFLKWAGITGDENVGGPEAGGELAQGAGGGLWHGSFDPSWIDRGESFDANRPANAPSKYLFLSPRRDVAETYAGVSETQRWKAENGMGRAAPATAGVREFQMAKGTKVLKVKDVKTAAAKLGVQWEGENPLEALLDAAKAGGYDAVQLVMDGGNIAVLNPSKFTKKSDQDGERAARYEQQRAKLNAQLAGRKRGLTHSDIEEIFPALPEDDRDTVYKEIAADEEVVEALEAWMVDGAPPNKPVNDKLLAYMRRLPPVPSDSYLTFYRGQPRGVSPHPRGWASWTTNKDETRFFTEGNGEVLTRKGVRGISLEEVALWRTRATGQLHDYGSQGEWLVLNESVFNQGGQPAASAPPITPKRTPLKTWNVGGPDAGGALEQAAAPAGVLTGDDGKPLVLYHGTNADIQKFDAGMADTGAGQSEGATWFSSSPVVTERFGAATMPVYLTAANVFEVTPQNMRDLLPVFGGGMTVVIDGRPVTADINREAMVDGREANVLDLLASGRAQPVMDADVRKRAVAAAKKTGADAVVFRGFYDASDTPSDIYAVFDPKQIVSAISGEVLGQEGQPATTQPITPKRTPLETWNAMTLDQKRPYHERWAESIEQYVMEGRAPSVELQPLMRRFAAWLKSVYGSIKQFLASRGQVQAGGEVLGQSAGAAQPDLFPGEFATKRTTVETNMVVDSKGTRAKGGNTNSKGQQVTATKQGLQRFWNWFEDSEVTDDKGRPLVLYHSTNNDVTQFETNRETTNSYGILGEMTVRRAGIFLTPDIKFSQEYLRDGAGQNVMQVYAALKNPLDLRTGLSETDWRALTDAGISTRYVTNIQNYWELFDSADDGTNDFVDGLKAAGYDGAIFHEDSPGGDSKGGTTYVAFEPNQVKSATGNRGTFDANDPSILSQDPAAPAGPPMALNDDIRRVMDRMLATDEQIAQANEVAGLVPDEAADGEAAERLRKRSIADLKWAVKARDKALAKLRKAAKGIKKEVRAQVTEEVNQRPEVQAKDALDKLRADKALDDASMAATADAFGFESPDAMLEAIDAFGSKAEAIDGMTEQRMLEEHGDLVDKRAIAAAANEAVHNEARARSLATELRTQSEMLNARAAVQADPDTRAILEATQPIELDDARALVAGKTEKPGGVDPLTWLKNETKGYRIGDVPLDLFEANEEGDRYDGTVNPERMADYAARNPAGAPPVIAAQGRKGAGKLKIMDGGHRISAARARGDTTIRALVRTNANMDAEGNRTNAKGSRVTVNVLMEAAKQFGANVAQRTPLADVRAAVWRHTQAERRAAKRWQEATAAGKTEEAVKAKQDQTLQHAAARALIEAQDEVRKTLDFFKRVATGNDETVVKKGRDADIVNAARAVLAAYGVETPTTKRADDYLDVIKQNDPETYAAIAPMVDEATRNAQPLRALTVGELQALSEQIGALWYLAKRSRQMEIGGDLLDIDDLATQLNGRMEEIGIPDTVPGEAQAVTKREARALFIRQGLSFLKRVEQWAEGMDGRYGGPFLRYVFQPIKAAADAYRADRTAYRKKLEALVSNLAPIVGDKKIDAPELGYTFGGGVAMNEVLHALRHTGNESNKRKLLLGYTFGGPDSTKGVAMNEVLHALLHTGNESNKRKLLLGRQWATENADGTLDTSRWDSFIQRLVATGKLQREHFDFVQGVWDLLEETKPLAQKAHRDAFGRYFAEVTAAPFVDPFGVPRKGGYVPAMVDPALVKDNALRKIAEAENESMSYAFPQPGKGFTMSRVEGYNRALMLDLRTIGQHLDKVLLFSHMTVPARSVRRLVTHKAVSQPLDRIDPTALEVMLQPWLQRSAQQVVETPIPGSGGWARVPSIIRARAGMALMFANVSNAIQQATGLSTAMVKVKPGFIMRAMAQHVAHPVKAAAAVWEASSYMNDRAKNEVAVLNESMRDILLDPSPYEKAQAWSQRHAYFLQTAIDNALSPIVWTGAYNQAMADGMTHDDAVAFADGTVRQTQGSTLPEDVSRFETGPAYARAFTQFIGYFNMVANTNVVAIKQIAGEMGLKRGAGRLFSVVMLGMMIPIWAAEAIAQAFKGGPDDEDKDGSIVDDWLAAVFGFGTAKGLLAMVPIVGQAANSAVTRLDNNPMNDRISLSPGLSLIESAVGGNVQTVAELFNPDKDVNARRAVRDAASLVSIATGLPLYAIARPAGYAAGVAQGKIEPTGPVDAARGLITGTPSPESKVR